MTRDKLVPYYAMPSQNDPVKLLESRIIEEYALRAEELESQLWTEKRYLELQALITKHGGDRARAEKELYSKPYYSDEK